MDSRAAIINLERDIVDGRGYGSHQDAVGDIVSRDDIKGMGAFGRQQPKQAKGDKRRWPAGCTHSIGPSGHGRADATGNDGRAHDDNPDVAAVALDVLLREVFCERVGVRESADDAFFGLLRLLLAHLHNILHDFLIICAAVELVDLLSDVASAVRVDISG